MDWKKFVSKIGFAVMLVSLSLPPEGFQKILGLILAGFIVLASIMLLFRNRSSKSGWKSFIHWVDEELDFTYIAFGLGLMLTGRNFLSGGFSWASFLLLISGVLFASYTIGQFIGKGFSGILRADARMGIIFGLIYFAVGVALLVMGWISITENPLLNAPYPALIIVLGIIFVYYGCKKWHSSRISHAS